jgi:DNA-binding transcriptional regulator YiaG
LDSEALMDSEALIDLVEARRLASSGEAHAIRVACGLSLKDIADAIGRTPASVSRWEAGSTTPYGPAARHYGRLIADLRDRFNESSPAQEPGSTKTTDAGGRRAPV